MVIVLLNGNGTNLKTFPRKIDDCYMLADRMTYYVMNSEFRDMVLNASSFKKDPKRWVRDTALLTLSYFTGYFGHYAAPRVWFNETALNRNPHQKAEFLKMLLETQYSYVRQLADKSWVKQLTFSAYDEATVSYTDKARLGFVMLSSDAHDRKLAWNGSTSDGTDKSMQRQCQLERERRLREGVTKKLTDYPCCMAMYNHDWLGWQTFTEFLDIDEYGEKMRISNAA